MAHDTHIWPERNLEWDRLRPDSSHRNRTSCAIEWVPCRNRADYRGIVAVVRK